MMFIAFVNVSAAVCRGFGWHVLGDLDVTHACFVFAFQVQDRGTVQPGTCLGEPRSRTLGILGVF